MLINEQMCGNGKTYCITKRLGDGLEFETRQTVTNDD